MADNKINQMGVNTNAVRVSSEININTNKNTKNARMT